MEAKKAWIKPNDATRLLVALFHEFAAQASVSLEGSLKHLLALPLVGVSRKQTRALRRQTLLPRQEFLVAPITPLNIELIQRAAATQTVFGPSGAVIHVQIAQGDRLVFGAYDHFDPECVVAYSGVSAEFLDRLKGSGVIRSYRLVDPSEHRWHD